MSIIIEKETIDLSNVLKAGFHLKDYRHYVTFWYHSRKQIFILSFYHQTWFWK